MMNDDSWPTQPPIAPPVEVGVEGIDAPDYVEHTEVLRSGGQVGRIVALLIAFAVYRQIPSVVQSVGAVLVIASLFCYMETR